MTIPILSPNAYAERLRRRGLERAQLFTWENTTRQTLQVYEQALNT